MGVSECPFAFHVAVNGSGGGFDVAFLLTFGFEVFNAFALGLRLGEINIVVKNVLITVITVIIVVISVISVVYNN